MLVKINDDNYLQYFIKRLKSIKEMKQYLIVLFKCSFKEKTEVFKY